MQSASSTPTVSRACDQLFDDIRGNPPGRQSLFTSHQLLSLHFFYDKQLQKALQLVDSGAVTCFIASVSRRKVFQVQGHSTADLYSVFPTHYCSCYSFHHDVVVRRESACCKHQLGARLAEALRICPVIEISDEALANLLLSH